LTACEQQFTILNVRSEHDRVTSVPAARRQRRRDADTRELLDAAERIFSARGYAGASIRDIASEAGFSVGGVYLFFPGKEELFAAVLEAVWQEYLAVTRAALKRPSFAERLTALTRASGEFIAARQSFLAIVLAEGSALDRTLGELVQEKLVHHRRMRRRQVVELMKSGLAEGVLRFGDAEFLASAYLGLLTRCQTDALNAGRELPPADDLVALFCGGASKTPRRRSANPRRRSHGGAR
jgi:AcrR family transcriptional regulator